MTAALASKVCMVELARPSEINTLRRLEVDANQHVMSSRREVMRSISVRARTSAPLRTKLLMRWTASRWIYRVTFGKQNIAVPGPARQRPRSWTRGVALRAPSRRLNLPILYAGRVASIEFCRATSSCRAAGSRPAPAPTTMSPCLIALSWGPSKTPFQGSFAHCRKQRSPCKRVAGSV